MYGCRVCTRTMLAVFSEKTFKEDEEATEEKRKETKTLIWRSAWNSPAIPLNSQHHEPRPRCAPTTERTARYTIQSNSPLDLHAQLYNMHLFVPQLVQLCSHKHILTPCRLLDLPPIIDDHLGILRTYSFCRGFNIGSVIPVAACWTTHTHAIRLEGRLASTEHD